MGCLCLIIDQPSVTGRRENREEKTVTVSLISLIPWQSAGKKRQKKGLEKSPPDLAVPFICEALFPTITRIIGI